MTFVRRFAGPTWMIYRTVELDLRGADRRCNDGASTTRDYCGRHFLLPRALCSDASRPMCFVVALDDHDGVRSCVISHLDRTKHWRKRCLALAGFKLVPCLLRGASFAPC